MMKWKDRPWMLYTIIVLAFVATGLLWRIHEDFSIDITIELLGAVITIVIIDELLVKSKRKRWNLVKNEVEYILARTINILRDDVLRNVFSFEPRVSGIRDTEQIESLIREQKDARFQELLSMPSEELLTILERGYLSKSYDGYFHHQAEDLWRILNTRYSEHLEPEVVDELLKLDLHMRDMHNNILLYNRTGEDASTRDHYRRRAGREMVFNTRYMIRSLVTLKKMGYSRITYGGEHK